VVKLSSDSAIAWASKHLQVEISGKESKGQEMEMNEPFVPDEQSIQQIICQEIHRTQEQPAGGVRQRKVSFSDNPGRQSRSNHQKQKSHQQNRSKLRRVDRKDKTRVYNSGVNPSHQSRHHLTWPNGLKVLNHRQKSSRAKVPAPQNRLSLSPRKAAL